MLQPQLGETRCQELRNSSFWPSSLFKSQLVEEGEDFHLKKGTSKDSQGFAPYQNKPFHSPTGKEAPTGNAPMGAIPLKAVTNRFPETEENKTSGLQGSFLTPE